MKPAVDKLPLFVRKGVRDTWDNVKGKYDQELSSLLGVSWSYTFNAALIYANCDRVDLPSCLGTGMSWYIEPFHRNLKLWLDTAGDDGKDEFNSIFSKHIVEIHPQETTTFTIGGIEAKDGKLRIVFADGYFVVNVDDVTSPEVITQAIRDAEAQGVAGATTGPLSNVSRQSIRDDWDGKYEAIREKIGQLINVPDVQFEPSFEDNVTKLSKPIASKDEYNNKKDIERFQENIGRVTREYFEALSKYLGDNKFGEDDMLQEGIQEMLSSKKIGLRVVDKLEKGSYNESVFEDGVLWMQIRPEDWHVNVSDIGNQIMDLL